ncbi:actin cortical patch SUR7/pH-response regulator pali [Zychaea mexicana]|uniref:actin cortical patch SUR7/pH-response regulator pali n=1 Tax=Zychaea mexicana TaxID=64656 RepID=UPI0022FEBD71|nr:actin cortical patch SUR7/pH-response regulator pali [Zychaea mexicana]KAI9489262.1 actin cortical patch SUR7/pH-response regulator pali [Zychaea mexicana]
MATSKQEYGATFLTFVALLLEVFVLISGSGNAPVLRDLFFAKVEWNGRFTRMGLWGSCYGEIGSGVDECSVPSVPFKWTEAEGLGIQLSVDLPDTMYLALFILYWIAFLATALAMQATLFTFFKRLPEFILMIVSLMATGALFIIFIIIVVAAAKLQNAATGEEISGQIGNATWLVLGAMIASALATMWYTFNCLCRRRRTTAFDNLKA